MIETQTASPSVEIAPPRPAAVRQRYVALDAARGFVMAYLCTDGFGLSFLKGSPAADRVASWFDHLRWNGFVPWELVMPAFMFMVGASIPFSLARRQEQGATFRKNFTHAIARVCRMALFGAVLYSLHARHYHADPIETLTQLGLSYLVVLLILQLQFRWQVVAAGALMALNWGLYLLFPGPTGPFDPTHNVGIRIDRVLFGIDHKYDWQTINFFGSAVTVLFGAWTTMLVQSGRTLPQKLKILSGAAVASLIVGLAITPINPIIHKCWTASFTFVHTACVLAMIAFFVWLFDPTSHQRMAFPLVVIGMNSIFIYLVNNGLKRAWLAPSVGVFTMQFRFLGAAGPVVQAWAVFFVMWYLCHWLYSHKIFFKI
jgi:heparan-alpha-glucosaminide N-acetyltransferase